MDIHEPIWNSTYRYYTFHVDVSDMAVELQGFSEPLVEDLSGIIAAFVKGSATHFVTPINPDVFASRLVNIFVGKDTIEGATPTMIVKWVPSSIRVYTTRFEIYWNIVSVDRNTIIPSGFLSAVSESEPIRTITIQQEDAPPAEGVSADHLGMELLEASSEAIEEAPTSGQDLARRRVREARLRVAASRLRAERLAESYFRKYGDIPLEEDSLSSDSDSDTLYPKNIGSH
jgi:hypothetical protein